MPISACKPIAKQPDSAPQLATAIAVIQSATATARMSSSILTTPLTSEKPNTTLPSLSSISIGTPSPEVETGELHGKLLDKKQSQPLEGIRVILCRIIESEKKKCELHIELVTQSIVDGSFSLMGVPSGDYVLVFDKTAKVTLEPLKGREVSYIELLSIPREKQLDNQFDITAIIDPFGGEKGIILKESVYPIIAGDSYTRIMGVVIGEGPVVSQAYGLSLEFLNQEALTVQIQQGETTEIEIR